MTMTKFRVTNAASGVVIGEYDADTATGALDAMAVEAGYQSHAEAVETAGAARFTVEAVEAVGPDSTPFACPDCGSADEWEADYHLAARQTVDLVSGPDGITVGEWTGCCSTFDDSDTETEAFVCGCGFRLEVGELTFTARARCLLGCMAEVEKAGETCEACVDAGSWGLPRCNVCGEDGSNRCESTDADGSATGCRESYCDADACRGAHYDCAD